jgi:hypothetical protein
MKKSIRLCRLCLDKAITTNLLDDVLELATNRKWLCPFESPECGLVFAVIPQRGKINHGKTPRTFKPN